MCRLAPSTAWSTSSKGCLSAPPLVPGVVAFAVTCRGCREQILAGEVIDDEAECILRDHFMIAHRDVSQPETRHELLRLFHVVPVLPPAV